MTHADTVAANFIRADGSVRHIVGFDPETGAFVRDYGGQGYAQGSSWTRGQTWALYGFVMSYKHTGAVRYLAMAQKVAEYLLRISPQMGASRWTSASPPNRNIMTTLPPPWLPAV